MAPKSIRELTPAFLIHPGQILNDELQERDIFPDEFAQLIGLEHSKLSDYLNGKHDFSKEFCIFVANALGMSKDLWFELIQNYVQNKLKIKE